MVWDQATARWDIKECYQCTEGTLCYLWNPRLGHVWQWASMLCRLFPPVCHSYGLSTTHAHPNNYRLMVKLNEQSAPQKRWSERMRRSMKWLLVYRSTPLLNGLSPSELLMGRQLRTQLPVLPSTLYPNVQAEDRQQVEKKEESYRSDQHNSFNKWHRAKELPPLQPGDPVWARDQERQGQVLGPTEQPRSYLVKTDKCTIRRIQSALVSTPNQALGKEMPVPDLVRPIPESPPVEDGNLEAPILFLQVPPYFPKLLAQRE